MAQLPLNFLAAPSPNLAADLPVHIPYGRSVWDRLTLGVDMTPQWIISALDRGERGEMRDLMLLNRRMEERLPGYAGAMGQLKYPLTQCEVRVQAASDDPRDVDLANAIEHVLKSDAFQLAKPDMLDALGVGYSLTEQRWGDVGEAFVPVAWQYVRPDLVRWAADGTTPELDLGMGRRAKLGHGRWIPHISRVRSGLPINGGMGRSVAMFYLFYVQAWLSLAAFARIFGLPLRTATYPPGTSPEDIAILEQALHQMGTEAVALMKEGMKFVIERANASGNAGSDQFFANYIKLIEEQVLMAVLGQTMTSQNGSSLAQAEVHERGKDLQIRALAFQISASWRAHLVRPIVDLNLGPDRPAPQVWLDVEDGDDIKALADGLVKLIDRGLPVKAVEIYDRCGLQRPENVPDDLTLVPLGSWAVSGDAANDKSEAMGRALAMVAEQLNTGRDVRQIQAAMRPVLAPLGYTIERPKKGAKKAS